MADEQQHEGHAPLLEAAVLVSDNCEGCRGTGFVVEPFGIGQQRSPWADRIPEVPDVPRRTAPCSTCEGSGRLVREVPLSELAQMLAAAEQRLVAPPPSSLREAPEAMRPQRRLVARPEERL